MPFNLCDHIAESITVYRLIHKVVVRQKAFSEDCASLNEVGMPGNLAAVELDEHGSRRRVAGTRMTVGSVCNFPGWRESEFLCKLY